MAKSSTKKRKVIVDAIGEAHITASFNNIIVSLTNKKGDVISWSSAGKMGFRGSKKNTPYAAQLAAEDAAGVAKEATGIPTISVGSVGLDKDFIKLYSGDHKTQTADLNILHEKLNNLEFDLIAVGRALLSDPDWANKVQDGKEDQIVPFDKSFVEDYV